jgi:hypothetical protein
MENSVVCRLDERTLGGDKKICGLSLERRESWVVMKISMICRLDEQKLGGDEKICRLSLERRESWVVMEKICGLSLGRAKVGWWWENLWSVA